MCEPVKEVGVKFGVTRAGDLAATCVQDIRHADAEQDDLRKVATELAGGQGTREYK